MLDSDRRELVQILRNRLVLVTGLLTPIVVSGYLLHQQEAIPDLGSPGSIAAIVTLTVLAFGLHTVIALLHAVAILIGLGVVTTGSAQIPLLALAILAATAKMVALGPGRRRTHRLGRRKARWRAALTRTSTSLWWRRSQAKMKGAEDHGGNEVLR